MRVCVEERLGVEKEVAKRWGWRMTLFSTLMDQEWEPNVLHHLFLKL